MGRGTSAFLAAVLLVAAMVGYGCTTLTTTQSTQLSPEELREGIRSGSLVLRGDEMSVETVDGSEHLFTNYVVDEDAIRGELAGGEEAVVPIDVLVALRTHQTKQLRTNYAALAGYGVAWVGGTLLVTALFMAGGCC